MQFLQKQKKKTMTKRYKIIYIQYMTEDYK